MKLTRDDLREYLQHPNVHAFLRALRLGEGTKDENGYRRLVGGGEFDSFADHPRVFRMVAGVRSSAAGAYQFLGRTWDGLVKQYGFPDFSPGCQDEAAVALICGRGAMPALLAGRIAEAVKLCNREWASLPGSPYGQPVVTLAAFMAEFHKWMSAPPPPVADTQPAAPIVELSKDADPGTLDIPTHNPSPSFSDIAGTVGQIALGVVMPQASILASVAKAAIPALINYAPDLIKIFSDKSAPVSERNTAAALKVLEIAQGATGARNAQEAVETLAADPNAQVAFRAAVQSDWYSLDPASVETSRKFVSEHPEAMSILRTVTVAALGFLAFANMAVFVLLGLALAVGWKEVSPIMQMASTVLQADIGAALIAFGYWLGSSNGSSVKTGMLSGPPGQ